MPIYNFNINYLKVKVYIIKILIIICNHFLVFTLYFIIENNIILHNIYNS